MLNNNELSNNTKTIKASFQKCYASDRQLFYRSSCIMPISIGIGQEVSEGERFLATIKLINSSFSQCTILLDDCIQRYTMQISAQHLSLDKLKDIAIKKGDEWLEKNKCSYSQLVIPYKILRWKNWHEHVGYKASFDAVDNLYSSDELYRKIVDDTIKNFIKRHTEYMNIVEYDYQRAFDNCLKYIKEECCVMCLWAWEGYDFEVYPSGRNNAMKATYERLVKPINNNILKSVGIRFKTLK